MFILGGVAGVILVILLFIRCSGYKLPKYFKDPNDE